MSQVDHWYEPLGSALEVLHARDDELLVAGPAGTGKSRACMEKVHLMCMLNPGMRALILRKTLTSLTATGLVTWREHVVREYLAAGQVSYYGGSQQESAQYRYLNGSTVTIGGMDRAPKIMSSEYDLVYVQEATELSENEWEMITTRLRNGKVAFQQLLADCNPDVPHHWLRKRVEGGRTRMLESRHEDNPTLFRPDGSMTSRGASYMSKLDSLTGVRHARLRLGKWVAAEGLVYEEYSPTANLLDRFVIPQSWLRYWSIDFGYRNPFVCQFWAEDPDGRLYLYREIYLTSRIVEDHARDILAIVAPGGNWVEPRPQVILCDHDAEDRATLERHLKLPTRAAMKTVSDGLQAVSARLRAAGDGKPRLFLLRDAIVRVDSDLKDRSLPISTQEEIVGYAWDMSTTKTKDVPLKENDHGMDAMRYLVAHRDLQPAYRIRSL